MLLFLPVRDITALRFPQIALAVVLLGGVVAAFVWLPDDAIVQLSNWVQANPTLAMPVYGAVFAVAVILMAPAWPFFLGAGYLFGPFVGVLVASLANLAGAVGAFLIARYLGGETVSKRVHAMPRFAALSKAISRNGLLIVALSRVAVVIPHNILNFAYGFTRVRFSHYWLGSWIGTLPVLALPVWIGSKATDLTAILKGDIDIASADILKFTAIGAAVVILLLVIVRVATRVFNQRLEA